MYSADDASNLASRTQDLNLGQNEGNIGNAGNILL